MTQMLIAQVLACVFMMAAIILHDRELLWRGLLFVVVLVGYGTANYVKGRITTCEMLCEATGFSKGEVAGETCACFDDAERTRIP